ncbi:hypothetical protein F7Q99_36225 [Streptomyces kaniharaensis]|uniref:Uncharacterized protein n=1 Tax=Streptomyces kaniharaensis TaxID=212423 RepID=A0A6N7L171_9ACTN|nr:hypothetical protein [Streptomyces kaniharaensis]MQS17490.1 hypothetical protein [Streptomyces kaniharaensis]
MPTTPTEYVRLSLEQQLALRARAAWPQLATLNVRHWGAFAYVAGELPGGENVKLMRLRYLGTASRWGFAPYSAAADRYEDAVLPNGGNSGSPDEALDCVCRLHFTAAST